MVGESVEQATLRALKIETLASINWQLAISGRDVPTLPDDEIASFGRRARGGVIPGGERWIWRHYVRAIGASDPQFPVR